MKAVSKGLKGDVLCDVLVRLLLERLCFVIVLSLLACMIRGSAEKEVRNL
jgi:hypothetical protein